MQRVDTVRLFFVAFIIIAQFTWSSKLRLGILEARLNWSILVNFFARILLIIMTITPRACFRFHRWWFFKLEFLPADGINRFISSTFAILTQTLEKGLKVSAGTAPANPY